MRYGSLFSGVGGFDLGLDRAGMTCAWQVEKDKYCRVVLAKHWADVPRYKDVKDVGKHNLGPVDLICGGFPCQDLSVAGNREGLAGERSGLWFEFLRIITELKPKWVVIENVAGLLSSNEGRDFAVLLRGLVKCGYGVAWRILDSQYFGVPQRRRRVFIVGHLGSGRAAQVLFERESGAGDTPPGRETRPELARDVAASLKGGSGQRGYPIEWEAGLTTTTTFNGYTGGADDNDAQGGHLVTGPLSAHSKRHGHAMTTQQAAEAGQLIAFGGNNTSETFIAGAAYNWQSGGDVRLSPGLPSLSVGQVPAVGVRRLTPVECERLQGFPQNWTAGQSDSQRYRQMGNAVTVPVIEWLGRRIAATASLPPLPAAAGEE